ncbi:hypothetical protein HanHA300_Chr16g0606521 [Helianthus annuus]|nr:hypothetical protein HanHA300_Chr16g0606521 [Helianthus annuus]KAJ0460138.1 hypothetical protein HanHA89_Chr16g0657101 [Helianthus annuus]KAJ0640580.1 hypothetical protein HanLR1_Chr16g0617121 [Helianthus annuus]
MLVASRTISDLVFLTFTKILISYNYIPCFLMCVWCYIFLCIFLALFNTLLKF